MIGVQSSFSFDLSKLFRNNASAFCNDTTYSILKVKSKEAQFSDYNDYFSINGRNLEFRGVNKEIAYSIYL
jgi:hypothetical protein